jgi:hypothetical protein
MPIKTKQSLLARIIKGLLGTGLSNLFTRPELDLEFTLNQMARESYFLIREFTKENKHGTTAVVLIFKLKISEGGDEQDEDDNWDELETRKF